MVLRISEEEYAALTKRRAHSSAHIRAPETGKPRAPRGPNKTEAEYARRFLDPGLIDGRRIAGYRYESITLVLAYRTRYTPDYAVWTLDGGLEFHEVKGGHMWEDSWVKLKLAAALFQRHRFVFARKLKTSWRVEEVPSR